MLRESQPVLQSSLPIYGTRGKAGILEGYQTSSSKRTRVTDRVGKAKYAGDGRFRVCMGVEWG